MNKKNLIQLTNNLYRLTLLFPKKEPLRFKIRELANEILRDLILVLRANPGRPKILILETEKDLDVLDSFFEVAKNQNWVSSLNLLEIQKEYSKIKEEFARLSFAKQNLDEIKKINNLGLPKDSPRTVLVGIRQQKILDSNPPLPPTNLSGGQATHTPPPAERVGKERNPRQKKILEFLREKGRAQVWELKKIFLEVSKRTLRRDFEQLLRQGLIERRGEKNNTFYQLKVGQKLR